jgi:hypothetical protein
MFIRRRDEMIDREKAFQEWLGNYNPALFKRVEKDACSYNELIAHQNARTAFNAALDLMDEEREEFERSFKAHYSKVIEARDAEIAWLKSEVNEKEIEIVLMSAQRKTTDLKEIARLKTQIDEVLNWCEAYPLDIFPEPDFKKAAKVLKENGMTLDAISASNMRHVLDGIKRILALPESEVSDD